MGTGVVVPIKKKFPHLKQSCLDYVKNNKSALGSAYRYQDNNRIVYNLFSKQYVYYKAGIGISYAIYLQTLKRCLIDLRKQMINHNEKILGIPKIGCGLDGCNWKDVKQLITEVFKNTDINILVCYI